MDPMITRRARRLIFFVSLIFIASTFNDAGHAQKQHSSFKPVIPKTWDEQALASLEVPLAEAGFSPKHISAEAYYRIPVRPIHKSYPKYHPDKEPSGYRERLRHQEPIVLWDDGAHRPKLETEDDWINAREIVYNAPVLFTLQPSSAEETRAFIAKTGDLYDKNGIDWRCSAFRC